VLHYLCIYRASRSSSPQASAGSAPNAPNRELRIKDCDLLLPPPSSGQSLGLRASAKISSRKRKMTEAADGGADQVDLDRAVEEDATMEFSEEDNGEGDDDDDSSDVYEYTYADDDGDGDDVILGPAQASRPTSSHVVFTGLDTIGNPNDMLLKKELTCLKTDIEKNRLWTIDLSWKEESRTLGVQLNNEGYVKANLELTFPRTYPHEPPLFAYAGPRYDDTVDFILSADVFEPTRKENWNRTFTCTRLLMIVIELVKDKYPITEELVFDEFERTLIQICRSRLPGIPNKVKEGMVYFGVLIEAKEKGSKRSSGVGYSNGGREAHDFSVHDAKFQEQLEGLRRFLDMSREATAVMLDRVRHIRFGSWLLQYLEEELPIFKFEEVHELLRQAVELVCRVDPTNEDLERVQEVFREREVLIRPSDGRLLAHTTEHVLAVQDEFTRHHYRTEAHGSPSIEVVKRIMLELENLKDNLRGMTDGQIFVVFSEASCLLWKVLMIPSSGTPYYGGCFEFHLAIPPDYPERPPKCNFMTTGGNQVRFNPNLYNNGKVCLSLLGTWSGEPWDPKHSNLSQLLISILAFIFTMEPLRNEPGLEGSPEAAISFYNAYIRLETVETAMVGMLQRPPEDFGDVIRAHFKRSWGPLIRPDLLAWADRHSFEESEVNSHSNGQITRSGWFRTAIGPGNYKKAMKALIAKLDEMVDGIRGDFGMADSGGADEAKVSGSSGSSSSSSALGPS
jgi:ubiquitin-protein ligase